MHCCGAGVSGAIPSRILSVARSDNVGLLRHLRDFSFAPLSVPQQQGIQVTMPLAISRNSASGASVGKGREENECKVR